MSRTGRPLSWPERVLAVGDAKHAGATRDPRCTVWRATRFAATPDLGAIRWALDELVHRHDALRTVPVAVGDALRQVRRPARPAEWRVVRVEADAGVLRRAVLREVTRPYDLEHGPLLRGAWCSSPSGGGILLVGLHHWAGDARAADVVLEELSHLYRQRTEDGPAPPAPGTYADAAPFLPPEAELGAERVERETAFWDAELRGARLAGIPAVQEPAHRTGRVGAVARRLSAETTAALMHVCGSARATPYQVGLTALGVTLGQRLGRWDLTVFGIESNRRSGARDVVGYFAEPVPLRLRLDPNASFAASVAAVRRSSLAAFEHSRMPFLALLERVPRRALALFRGSPPVTVFQSIPAARWPRLPGFDSYPVATVLDGDPLDDLSLAIDLDVVLEQLPDGLSLHALFSRDLWDDATVAGLIEEYATVLARSVRSPDVALSELAPHRSEVAP